MDKKLIVCYIIENDEDVFKLSYDSIKDVADEIVIIDGNKENLYDRYLDVRHCLHKPYPHKDKGANGMQRNKYLDYVKAHFKDDWCLVLDADEIVDQPHMIKNVIQQLEEKEIDCCDIWMRHFVNTLGTEDATVETHYVNHRLFKITKNLKYPEVEHPLLQGWKKLARTTQFCIYHLGYAREMLRLKKKYDNHLEKSNIHTPQYLEDWYHRHLFGEFPVKKVDTLTLPDNIKKAFNVNEDYLYFRDRGCEIKHCEMVKQWNEYFGASRTENYAYQILDIGCGRGPYLRYWEMCCDDAYGLELSQWAIDNKICDSEIFQGDITKYESPYKYDLVTAIDILEHLEYKDLDKALKNIYNLGINVFLFSIPFIGDPNLEADSTHIIKESKEWWVEKLEKAGFKIKETPENFLFKEQIIIAEK